MNNKECEQCGHIPVRCKGLCAKCYDRKRRTKQRHQRRKAWRKASAKRANDPERKSYEEDWRKQNREKLLQDKKDYYQRRGKRRAFLKKLKSFGLSEEQFNELVARGCEICGEPLRTEGTVGRSYPAIDHDHDTGKFRGILCSTCNSGLGLFYDNSEALRRAADYLDKKE